MSGRRRAHRAFLSQLVVLLALAVAASSGCTHAGHRVARPGPGPTVPAGRVPPELDRAVDAVVAARTGRFRMLMEVDAIDAGRLAVLLTGAFDRPAHRLSASVHHEDLVAAAREHGVDAPGTLLADRDVVIDGGTVYLRGPELVEELGATGWVSVAGSSFDDVVGRLVEEGAVTDASAVVELLRGSTTPFQADGDEVVDGVHLRRFATSVRTDSAIAAVSADRRGLVERQLAGLGEVVGALSDDDPQGTAIPTAVWLADDGALRAARFTFPTDPETSGVARARVTVTLYDYGGAIAIPVPSASEAQPLAELTGGPSS